LLLELLTKIQTPVTAACTPKVHKASTILNNNRRFIYDISSLFLGAKIAGNTDNQLHFLTLLPYFMAITHGSGKVVE
jgi:hypothetical protein